MRYSIFYLIKGEAKKYRDNLVKEVGPKFGERYVLKSKIPAHLTIKTPFEIKDIKKVEQVIKEFVKNHKPSKIKIVGFGEFRKKDAFLNFKFSENALKMQNKLIKEISKIKGIEIKKHDKKWNPHETISYTNTRKNFKDIWNYLKKLEKPSFELNFDNITIMKKSGKYWEVHKEFKLKDSQTKVSKEKTGAKMNTQNAKITAKTKFDKIMEINPEAGMILFEYGMHCVGCGMASMETLEQGCLSHGMDKKEIKELIEKLNKEGKDTKKVKKTSKKIERKIKKLTKDSNKNSIKKLKEIIR